MGAGTEHTPWQVQGYTGRSSTGSLCCPSARLPGVTMITQLACFFLKLQVQLQRGIKKTALKICHKGVS